jgi:hypothetical protein
MELVRCSCIIYFLNLWTLSPRTVWVLYCLKSWQSPEEMDWDFILFTKWCEVSNNTWSDVFLAFNLQWYFKKKGMLDIELWSHTFWHGCSGIVYCFLWLHFCLLSCPKLADITAVTTALFQSVARWNYNQHSNIIPVGSPFPHFRNRNHVWNCRENYSTWGKFLSIATEPTWTTLELNPHFALQTSDKSCLGMIWGFHSIVTVN